MSTQRANCIECGRPKARPRNDSKLCRSCATRAKWASGQIQPSPQHRVSIVCEVCASTVEVIVARTDTARVCSAACNHELKRRITGSDHPLSKPRVHLRCESCGEGFDAKACFADPARGKRFCSRQCVGAWVSSHQPRMSSIEELVAVELDRLGVSYLRQQRVGRFVPDFVVGMTIIEVDGDYWHSLPKIVERDKRKAVAYERLGYRLIRITETDVRAGRFDLLKETAA